MENKNFDHIIFSYAFDCKGGGKKISREEVSVELKDKNPAWAHLISDHPNTKKWLTKTIDYLDPIIVNALTVEESRPRLEEFDEGSLLILRGVNLNPNSEPEDMISIRLWIDANRIISLQKRELKAVQDIETKLKKGKGPKSSADFVVALATRLIERMEPVINELEQTIDDLEEKILENPDINLRSKIVEARRDAILLRRYIAPQREVINRLRASEQPWLDVSHKRLLHENYDRITRYVEDLDTVRERSQIIQDELQNMLSDKMNKNMYVLSVIAAIFLPLGFLTGLLGINVGGIPGAENANSFFVFCAMLTIVVIAQIAVFKKMKWF